MRNVVRSQPPPKSLQNNAEIWKNELLRAIRDGSAEQQERVSNNYKQDDVLQALDEMYSGLCCFCEAKVGVVNYETIEHLKPKGKNHFPDLTFDWNNLNLVCTVCNTKKGSKYDHDNPILDPAGTEQIVPDHLRFDSSSLGFGKLEFSDETPRGKTTIEHTGLNRDKLARARFNAYLAAFELKQDLDSCTHQGKLDRVKRSLNLLLDGGFITVIRQAISKSYFENSDGNND